MTTETELQLTLSKAGSIGKAQARYALAAIASAVAGYAGIRVPALSFIVDIAPSAIALCIMAWFGMGRAGAEVQSKLKSLIPDYNYGLYGGAVPFIWAVAYAPHGKGGMQRIAALVSYPAAFTLLLSVAVVMAMVGSLEVKVFSGIWLTVAAYQTAGLWKNRIKAML